MNKRDKQTLALGIIAAISTVLLVFEFNAPMLGDSAVLIQMAQDHSEFFVKMFVWMPQIRIIGLTLTALIAGYSAYGISQDKISSKKSGRCVSAAVMLFILSYVVTSLFKVIALG